MTESIILQVTGMKCGGCESSISEKVGAIDGVILVNPMHKENTVEVEFDDSKTTLDIIKKTITEAGFSVQ